MSIQLFNPYSIFFFHQHIFIILYFGIALIVHKIIDTTRLCGVDICEIVKTETQFFQGTSKGSGFYIRIQLFEDRMIVFQYAINLSDEIACFTQFFVVEGVSAAIVAEFLICPSF